MLTSCKLMLCKRNKCLGALLPIYRHRRYALLMNRACCWVFQLPLFCLNWDQQIDDICSWANKSLHSLKLFEHFAMSPTDHCNTASWQLDPSLNWHIQLDSQARTNTSEIDLRQSRDERYELHLVTALASVIKCNVCSMASFQLTLDLTNWQDLSSSTKFANLLTVCIGRCHPHRIRQPSHNSAVRRSCWWTLFTWRNDSVIIPFLTALTSVNSWLLCELSEILLVSISF